VPAKAFGGGSAEKVKREKLLSWGGRIGGCRKKNYCVKKEVVGTRGYENE